MVYLRTHTPTLTITYLKKYLYKKISAYYHNKHFDIKEMCDCSYYTLFYNLNV